MLDWCCENRQHFITSQGPSFFIKKKKFISVAADPDPNMDPFDFGLPDPVSTKSARWKTHIKVNQNHENIINKKIPLFNAYNNWPINNKTK